MLKIALLFLGGCVFFGLLKIVTSERISDIELATSEDVEDENQIKNEKTGTNVAVATYRPKQNILPEPSPNPIQMNLIECYVCTDCPKVLLNTSSKLCPYTLDLTKQGCVVYAEQYKHMRRPWYIRGCASERGSCADIRKAHAAHADIVSLLFCSECDGDRCNTNDATHSISDFTLAFFAIVVTPLIAKYTLS